TKTAIQDKNPDAIYDHPTPIESRSTLPRLLNSLKNTDLPTKSTKITVIAATTHKKLEEKARERVNGILNNYKDYFEIRTFSASTLNKLSFKDQNLANLLSFYGYSNIRNLGLVIAQILRSNYLVFLDDDVVVNDPKYFAKIQESVGKSVSGKFVGGIAGYYVNEDGKYFLTINSKSWWQTGWPKERKMNEAFKIINSRQRLTDTTFAFGGNMGLHWKMYEKVPFDPYITRGEDMDLLVNAQMFSFEFLLDTTLRVLHLPGERKNRWSEMRQDLYRFLYMRRKMLAQKSIGNTKYVSIDSLEPYPGHFLRSGVFFKFMISSCLNGLHSIQECNFESFKGFTCNTFQIPFALDFAISHRLDYLKFQRKWANYVPKIRDDEDLRKILDSLP
ncbi:MAG: hypothetical protein PVH12_05775, partial [Candidatus Bathyarchaeota archaeon]